jgi:hypothetical protein
MSEMLRRGRARLRFGLRRRGLGRLHPVGAAEPRAAGGWKDSGCGSPFSARLNAALWTAKTVAEGGTGNLFYAMKKEAAGDILGLTLQTGFVTKAQVGLFGSDRSRLAVSADGSTFVA